MTIERAAAHLGVSHRTVRTYISTEVLTPFQAPGDPRKYLDAASVDELRSEREKKLQTAAELRVEVRELRAGLRRMRSELDAVLHILDLRERPLGLTAETARVLWSCAEAEEKNTSWENQALLEWADTFARIREEDMAAMRDATKTASWRPFLDLCARMCAHVRDNEAYATSTDLQLVHRHLCEGRRRMRVAAACDAELCGKNEAGTAFLIGARLDEIAEKRAKKQA